MKNMLRVVLSALAIGSVSMFWALPASAANQSCVSKCAEEENACLKRTNNKGQCGDKAKACTAKCK